MRAWTKIYQNLHFEHIYSVQLKFCEKSYVGKNSANTETTDLLDEEPPGTWYVAGDDLVLRVYWNNATSDIIIDADSSVPDVGFANVTTPADTHPFNSGDKCDYDVQAGDELNGGTTYYWRVRGTDPSGTNTAGAWATARSFTTLEGDKSVDVNESYNY